MRAERTRGLGIEREMSFARTLAALEEHHPLATKGARPARVVYVAYDQLSTSLGALKDASPHETCVVLVENAHKARRRPYHKQKLALVLANQRHFALELARAGFFVRFVVGDAPYDALLRPLVREVGPLTMMRAAERELRHELAPLIADGAIVEIAHDGWLTTTADFERHAGKRSPWRMDRFYRGVRKQTGVLMEAGEPVGGRFSFDDENRQPWRGVPEAPAQPTFAVDDIKREVAALVEARFAAHPGTVALERLPATDEDARALWRHARTHALPHFGPFEDAMSTRSSTLFHAGVSPLLNLHRLLPRSLVDDVLAMDIPLASKEGFVRQVLGWREFVHHVHERTDGFRTIPGMVEDARAGDGGYTGWRGAPLPGSTADGYGGARPAVDDDGLDVPPAYWGTPSGLACLDHVVADVWRDAWSHHITRLMVLANIATLVGVDARALTDWFFVAYADAFDWVVEPNVLAMGTFATGDVMTTKPYVSGAGYIDRMGDYCGSCAFSPKKDCPLTPLYWAYLARHEPALATNPRMKLPLASLRARNDDRRREDAETRARVREALARGEALVPLRSTKRRA